MVDADRISIHALREEGDQRIRAGIWNWPDFYPRPPRGGRLLIPKANMYIMLFLSTPSARRATEAVRDYFLAIRISIHALREEGDHS